MEEPAEQGPGMNFAAEPVGIAMALYITPVL
jgi:hypothetical protein